MAKRGLNETETSEYLGVSVPFLRKLRKEQPHKSPPFFKIGTRIIYDKAKLDDWIEEMTDVTVSKGSKKPS